MEEQYNYEINNYNEEQAKRYELISKIQQNTVTYSYSWLKEMLNSPYHFIEKKLKRTEKTESMLFGSLTDLLITEPDNLNEKFSIVSKVPTTDQQKDFCNYILNGYSVDESYKLSYKSGNSDKIYKELKPYLDSLLENKDVISDKMLQEATEVKNRLLKSKSISLLIDSANLFQQKNTIEYEGYKIKLITDMEGIGLKLDLKLMSKLNPSYIDKEIFKMHYDLQGAIYTLENKDSFFNICYDRKGNSLIAEYDDSVLRYGKDKLDYILNCIYKCCENPSLFAESYNFHDIYNEKLGIKTKRIYKPTYLKSYR